MFASYFPCSSPWIVNVRCSCCCLVLFHAAVSHLIIVICCLLWVEQSWRQNKIITKGTWVNSELLAKRFEESKLKCHFELIEVTGKITIEITRHSSLDSTNYIDSIFISFRLGRCDKQIAINDSKFSQKETQICGKLLSITLMTS